jgi:hypothetical protein
MQQNFDFSTSKTKVNYKAMFQPKVGDNIVRFFSPQGKQTEVHWLYHPKTTTIRCPGKAEGCPLCRAGEKTVTSYFAKVIDRATGTIKAYEMNERTKDDLLALKGEIMANHGISPQEFSQHDVVVTKSMMGGKGVINFRFLRVPPDSPQRVADEVLIKADTLDLADTAQPAPVEFISDLLVKHPENLRRGIS